MRIVLSILLFCLLTVSVTGQRPMPNAEIAKPKSYRSPNIQSSTELHGILHAAVKETLDLFASKNFKPTDIAATIIDLGDRDNVKSAEYRGNERIYPASVVKMFYLGALQRQLDEGKIIMTAELSRGRRDMIVDSSNEATQYIFDVLTGTASGAEMPKKEFDVWQHKRNRVNRYFTSLGYENINVNQKTFCEDAYGIEQQSRNYKGENRNMLTTNATARLFAEIVLGRVATPQSTQHMMELLKRDPFAKTNDPDDQAHGFIGRALIERGMTDAKLWSKAGWTSKTRHDAAYIETADGRKFVLVIFTENHGSEKKAIPTIAGKMLEKLK